MSDEQAIRALIHEYASRLDDGDLDGVADLFAHAELTASTHDRVRRGREEARQLYDDVVLFEDGTPRTMHQMTNVTVVVEGSSATARSYFTVLQVTAQGLHPVLAGVYEDAFEHVDGAWRFTRRHFVPRLYGDLTRHYRT
jgi:uncharacterized protein (TIGR02246 family)